MICVLDASAAYGMLMGTYWDAMMEDAEELIAPDLIVPELLNARWKVARVGSMAPLLDVVLQLFEQLRIVPTISYGRDAALLAQRIEHSVYDCIYAVVAKREGAKLLTSDLRFTQKLQGTPYAEILP